ncbi:MAG: hypothetical protein COB04_11325 [Gammaproteobacteria bacterium]|nr:MAG: hypothetical protein COB04_11325 [Gammaproteobacteria bacterium]
MNLNAANDSPPQVLIIDDDLQLAETLREKIFVLYGFSVVIVSTLKAASQLLEQNHQEFFVAFSELRLSDALNGEAVDLTLSYNIPTIVMTVPINQSLLEDLQDKNIADYVFKERDFYPDYVAGIAHRIFRNKQTKVVVVDESRSAMEYMCRLLKLQKYQVFEAPRTSEVKSILDLHPDVRIIIIDCFLGRPDALALTHYIRERYQKSQLVIIGVSRHGSHDLCAQFIKNGANDFLLKPFLPVEFLCRVNNAAEFLDQVHEIIDIGEHQNQLIGMAAHDIRGPISGNIGLMDLLLSRDADETKSKIYMEIIQKTNIEMLDLLNSLLDVSAVQSSTFDLNTSLQNFEEIVNDRINLYKPSAAKKNISIDSNLPEHNKVLMDPTRIKQVVDNLLTNAIKYSPSGSHIHVNIEKEALHLRLDVIDQGPGIPENEEHLLFGAFEKLSPQPTAGETSCGLGLAICKNIVDAHGGHIGYHQGTDQKGSCFFVHLPSTRLTDHDTAAAG